MPIVFRFREKRANRELKKQLESLSSPIFNYSTRVTYTNGLTIESFKNMRLGLSPNRELGNPKK